MANTNYNEIPAKPKTAKPAEKESRPKNPEAVENRQTPRKPPLQIDEGTPVIKKKNAFARLANHVLGPDYGVRVRDYVVREIIGPNLRDVIYNSIMASLGMAVYKDNFQPERRSSSSSWRSPSSRTTNRQTVRYDQYSQTPSRTRTRYTAPIESSEGVVEHVFQSMQSAKDTVRRMQREIDLFGYVTISDYYHIIDEKADYTDETFGWTDLSGVVYQSLSGGGVIIEFPPTESV